MEKETFMRLLTLCIICCALGFIACSGGEEDIDDVLSKETTPVTFELGKNWSHILFDYTDGGTYVGSDTIHYSKNAQEVVELRQGKHQLLWIKGLYAAPYDENYRFFSTGVHFLRESNTFFAHMRTTNEIGSEQIEYDYLRYPVFYWKKSLEVSPYLLPVQKPDYVAVTGTIAIYFTDEYEPVIKYNATLSNIPIVSKVGMEDKRSELMGEGVCDFTLHYLDLDYTYRAPDINIVSLCPLNGLNNIQLVTSAKGNNDDPLSTTQPPMFSLKRGYTTKLIGPLFSGSTSDWKVEMIPYNDTY